MKKSKMNWQSYREELANCAKRFACAPPLNAPDMIALLDERDLAQTKLREILAECPQRPTKPFAKRIKTLAQDGLNGSR